MRKTNAKLGRRDPSPLCVSPLKYQSFSLWVFTTLAGAHGSGSEVPMEVVGVFVFTVFQLTQCLSWVFCFFCFKPSLTTNRNIGLWGGQRKGNAVSRGHSTECWRRVCGWPGGMNQILEKDASLLGTLRMIELTILDAVISLLGSKMFFMIQMKNVARGCYSF